jgi:membrane protein
MPFVILSKKVVLPGFHGIPLYNVVVFFVRGLQKSSINIRAAAVSFNFVMAGIPALLFFFSLIPYIPIEGLHEMILNGLKSVLPTNAFLAIRSTIEDVILKHRGGLLSFGILASMYFFSNGIMSLMNAFNQSSHTIETRPAFYRRLVSLGLTLVLSIIVIILGGTMLLHDAIIHFLEAREIVTGGWSRFLINIGQGVLVLIMSLFAISVIYYAAPAKRGTFSFFSPGAVFVAFLLMIFAQLFAFITDNFGQQNKLYGSLGTVMVIFIWINLNTLIILIGFELNASIHDAKKFREKMEAE